MVCQRDNRLDFASMMNNGKIVLAKLSHGAIGEENAYLVGSLLVSKLHQMCMSRQHMPAAKRRPFYVYIDEFHNFVTPSMSPILSGGRKYSLGLILAHQELRQLLAKDSDVASAVIVNPFTRVCFRLGDADARKLQEGFSFFESKDLQNLGTGEAICRVERAEYDFNLKTAPMPSIDEGIAASRRERVIALSREQFGTQREQPKPQASTPRPAPPVTQPPAPVVPAPAPPAKEPEPIEEPVVVVPTPPEPATKGRKKKTERPPEPATPGRGGPQHKYLQQLIKHWAEDRGYRATIEKSILDGLGSVDVALENDARSIACEICITTSVEHEIGNIQKCLAAGFDYAVMISSDKKIVASATQFLTKLNEADAKKVSLFSPEEFFSFVGQLEAAGASSDGVVKGYKVKVRYNPVSEADEKARKKAIAQTLASSMKRLKPKS